MPGQRRRNRVASQIQRELGDVLLNNVKDPRVKFCCAPHVEMSPDLSYANIQISILGNDQQKNDGLAGLKSASGFIRREISHRLGLRTAPELRFKLDASVEQLMYIDQLLEKNRE